MYIVVDYAKCTGLGICESIAPDHFEIADDGQLGLVRDDVGDEHRAVVEEAVQACPTVALRLAAER